MDKALLLFDIDGTLLRSGGAGVRAMHTVADRLFGGGFRWEGVVFAGNTDPRIYAEAAELNGLHDAHDHHQRFHDHYIEELQRQIEANRPHVVTMPGITATIDTLRRRAEESGDVELGLLTGNYTQAVPIKLRAVGIEPEWFTITAFGDEGRTRPDLVEVAMAKYRDRHGRSIDPRHVLIVGDTPRDVHCAKAHQCLAFAVATGGYSVDELRSAGADAVAENLADPQPLLSFIDAMLA